MACNDLRLICYISTACPHSFMSDHGEKRADPKSGRDLNPDHRGWGCTMSCQGGEIDP